MNVMAGCVLIFCALSAWYMMSVIILNDLAGKEVLRNGKALAQRETFKMVFLKKRA